MPLLKRLARHCRRIKRVWADGGYAGKLVARIYETCNLALTIVKRGRDTKGFQVLPRRCTRDYERLPEHHETMVKWTMIHITSKRLAKQRL